MYNSSEESSVIVNTTNSSNSVIVDSIDLSGDISPILSDSKETFNYHNLDQPKMEFTMDASFLYEDNANPCMYPVAPPPTPVTPFQRQYQPSASLPFFNYPNMSSYNYGYSYMQQQQPNYMYSHQVPSSAGSHNSLLNLAENSAFTPMKPKFFTPRLLNFENQNEINRSYQTAATLSQKNGHGRKKKPSAFVPPVLPSICVSPPASQSVQLKEIQEIFTNTQIPIVSILFSHF